MKVPLVSPDCEQPDQPARHVLVRRLGQVGHQAPLASHHQDLQDLTLSDGVREQEAESVRVAGVSQGGQHGSLCPGLSWTGDEELHQGRQVRTWSG